jgi:Family of unknown function (DUF6221)
VLIDTGHASFVRDDGGVIEMTAFLAARIDEAEARANAMEHFTVHDDTYLSCPATRSGPVGDLPWGEEHCYCRLAVRKGRARREAEARRSILRRCAARMNELDAHPSGLASPRAVLARQILTDLAAIDSDHPDYDPA